MQEASPVKNSPTERVTTTFGFCLMSVGQVPQRSFKDKALEIGGPRFVLARCPSCQPAIQQCQSTNKSTAKL